MRRETKVNEFLSQFDQVFISTNTFVTCFYVLRKSQLSKEQIYLDLSKFEILEIDKNDCHLAYNLAQNIDDIEDCPELFTVNFEPKIRFVKTGKTRRKEKKFGFLDFLTPKLIKNKM